MNTEIENKINQEYREHWAYIGELKRKAKLRRERRINTVIILSMIYAVLGVLSVI